MRDDIAISVSHLSKNFLLPHERRNSLKELVLHFKKPSYETFHALHDVNFEVKKGEFFGIVGRNGSGKSTLLKILGGIYQPTTGEVKVNGALTPFIELGIGFNPELTGRENVFLNGAILGLSRKEVTAKYDEIVSFAEIEKFMDQKLKNYSSGMQVRLAFSIAMQAHNGILLIDEVLAVGDANFQRKCFAVFNKIKKEGDKTVVFVTHDMGAIQEYCDRAMMIQDSEVIAIGVPREVALRYDIANSKNTGEGKAEDRASRPKNPAVHIDSVKLRNLNNDNGSFSLHDTIDVDITFTVRRPTEIQFNLFFVEEKGRYLAGVNSTVELKRYLPPVGTHTVTLKVQPGQINEGLYQVNCALYTYCEWPSAESPLLIDVFDTSYGEATPQLRVIERSSMHSGEFNLASSWSESKAKDHAATPKH